MRFVFTTLGVILASYFLSNHSISSIKAATILDCSRKAGSKPFPDQAAGTADHKIPVEHILVIMQENHSFDQYFGQLNQPQYYGSAVDGISDKLFNLDKDNQEVHSYHEKDLCIADTDHMWNAEQLSWNNGKNDGFAKTNGRRVMAYYDQTNLPYYYELANQFAIADRYFSSILTSTYPNRFFLMAGTSFGHIHNDEPKDKTQFTQKTIFDLLDEHHITWKYYNDDIGYLVLFQPLLQKSKDKIVRMAEYQKDLDAGTLPQVSFIDAEFDTVDEHPDADVQVGQAWVAGVIRSLMKSSLWKSSALFLTYDENGAFYDHVSPPEACEPDGIAPHYESYDIRSPNGAFNRYGFRVPFVLVSPYSKRHFVSHITYDHTSILKFIETKFNLPALTARDANADAMLDLFDFDHPRFDLPDLPSGEIDPRGTCNNPPKSH